MLDTIVQFRSMAHKFLMSSRTPSWDRYEVLLAVLDTGSLSAASRALGVSQPTVRRQVELLEAELGATLFTRTVAGLQPTEAALAGRGLAEDMARAAAALARAVSGGADEAAGVVRLACSEVVGVELLPPMIASLVAAHSALEIELHVSNRDEDILRREADIAVRMHRPLQVGLLARKVGSVAVGLFASRDYAARRGLPQAIEDLPRHALIGQDRLTTFADALAAVLPASATPTFGVRSDNDLAQLGLVSAGAGIGVCQVAIARRRGLIPVLPEIGLELPVWLTMHEDLKRIRRYRIVFDSLARFFAEPTDGPPSSTATADDAP
jgi:DNA-binding transcriptional LysR family regulator